MEWVTETAPITYPEAMQRMEQRVAAIQAGKAGDLGWMLEHPPLYTLGTSADKADVLKQQFPTYETGRGGQVTYHGPGQRVVYVMRDLKRDGEPDLRAYVKQLEAWIIAMLAEFKLEGFTREGRIGVWVSTQAGEAKIAALGVRVQKWVSSHGIALNVNPDLSHYAGIVPCGIREFGVTSLKAMGVNANMAEVDAALKRRFAEVFALAPSAAA